MKVIKTLKKGERYSLDYVYPYLGTIPTSSYHQHEITLEKIHLDDNDSGESILMLETVHIRIETWVHGCRQ